MYIVTDSKNKVVYSAEKEPVAVSEGLTVYNVADMPNVDKNKDLYYDGVEFTCKDKPVIKRPYGQEVESLIRLKYSLSEELAILRQRDTKPEEFQEYFDYAEECKKKAKGDDV